jgi:hypothetical protein
LGLLKIAAGMLGQRHYKTVGGNLLSQFSKIVGSGGKTMGKNDHGGFALAPFLGFIDHHIKIAIADLTCADITALIC